MLYEFDWDPAKARQNLKKHGVSFDRAAKIFLDPFAISIFDERHSENEDRWVSIGTEANELLIVVVHTFTNVDAGIEPDSLISLINGWQVAKWAIEMSYRWQPALKPHPGPGRKPTSDDATVLVTVIVMRVWRKGYESFTDWLERHSPLAQKLGYTETDPQES